MSNYENKRYEIQNNTEVIRYDKLESTTNKTGMSEIIRMVILRRAITHIGNSVKLKQIKLCCERYLDYMIDTHDARSYEGVNIMLNNYMSFVKIESIMIKQLTLYCWNDIFYRKNATGLNAQFVGQDVHAVRYLVYSFNEGYEKYYNIKHITLYLVMHNSVITMKEEEVKEWLNTSILSHKISCIMFALSTLSEEGYLIKDIQQLIMNTIIYTI